jgi:hypothetical protein
MTEANMNDLTTTGSRDVEQFDPERFKVEQAAIDFTIEEAKLMQKWDVLEQAVDFKIDQQRRFIAWRDANIRGAGQPKKNSCGTELILLSDAHITDLSGIDQVRASRMRSKLRHPDQYRRYLLGSEYMAAFLRAAENVRGTMGTGENEWFTPSEYLVLVREVLGDIDLDPASSAAAQEIVRAHQFFDEQINGLKQEWHGRVFLNPPYGQPLIAKFITKLAEEWDLEHIACAITLTHNYTDTAWFQKKLVPAASAICFTSGRVKFYEGDHVAQPTQGQAFCYLGDDPALFADVFSAIGFIAMNLIPVRKSDA